uniref:Uncharacterized protein n=1 Tax=Vespula pensylvanica TaxID=30213 RepID=A0A834N4X3_VESPE|nr:hypothetical protein H0235_016482 [Vespula pensylvanica]
MVVTLREYGLNKILGRLRLGAQRLALNYILFVVAFNDECNLCLRMRSSCVVDNEVVQRVVRSYPSLAFSYGPKINIEFIRFYVYIERGTSSNSRLSSYLGIISNHRHRSKSSVTIRLPASVTTSKIEYTKEIDLGIRSSPKDNSLNVVNPITILQGVETSDKL